MVARVREARVSLAQGRRIIIKIGSALLVDSHGALRMNWLRALAEDVARLRARGQDVALVSSGSIALGRGMLNLPQTALSLEMSQAAAAAGQIALARAYSEALGAQGLMAAQILLTLEDTRARRRYLNGRATLEALMRLGAVAIINENDTVATDEIRYGDNDRLAARVALMCGADRLVLLSDIDGLYDANPAHDPAAQRLEIVPEITPDIEAMAGDAASSLSKGGMRTKILAAKTAITGGCAMVIARGDVLRPLEAIEQGANCTWFLAAKSPARARKNWISGLKPTGALALDAGAVRALRRDNSLLPAGVIRVEGDFARGDAVSLRAPDGAEIGRAICGYSALEAARICGRKSDEIKAILGYTGRAAMAHKDDIVLWNM